MYAPRESFKRQIRLGTGMTILAAMLLVPTSISFADKEKIPDSDIATAVESEFWTDEVIDANGIDVTSQDGIVTLTGSASNLLAKERAKRIASSTVGVRGIVNRISVMHSTLNDDVIKKRLRNALLSDPATDSYEVTVSVEDGVATLNGSVDSWQEKQLCSVVAKSVRGVRDVKNIIKVACKADRAANEIKREAEARLKHDVLVDDYLIDVKVKDSRVSLSGTVGSLSEKHQALADAWVGGVNSVDGSKLEVEWWARDTLRRTDVASSRTDKEIRKAIKDAFLYDPRVLSFNPEVKVKNNIVTLTGVVDNLRAKKAAEADARNIIGVWSVTNHLKVRPADVPNDEILEKRVRRASGDDPFVERWDIGVSAHSGTVYLSGDVNTTFEKDRAEHVAEGVVDARSLGRVDFATGDRASHVRPTSGLGERRFRQRPMLRLRP